MSESRVTYRRSGRANWLLLALWVVPIVAVAMLMAGWLNVAYIRGCYFILVTPVVLAVPLAGMMYLAVGTSHCRSWSAAVALGTLAGGLLFFGHFYYSMISTLGPAAARHPELLPQFIAWRVCTDIKVDFPRRDPAAGVRGRQGDRRPGVVLNVITYSFELFAVLGLSAGIGARAAGRAYCENCRRRMRRQKVKLPLGLGPRIADALHQGTLQRLPEILLERKADKRHTAMTVEYCAHGREPFQCGVYLTLARRGREEYGRSWLNQARLTSEELAVLAGVVPPLRPLAKALVGWDQGPQPSPEPAESVPEPTPIVEPAPIVLGVDPFSLRSRVLRRLLSLVPMVGALGGFVAAMAALYIYTSDQNIDPQIVKMAPKLAFGGIAVFFAFGVCVARNNLVLSNRFARWMARRTIESRPDLLVRPDDPGSVFVEVVPREQWNGVLLDRAADSGFLLVDLDQRRVLVEGVRQRYRIPHQAIAHCRVETMDTALDQFSNYAVVVGTRQPSRPDPRGQPQFAWTQWEAPLVPRQTRLLTGKKGRRQAADDLCRRIRKLMPMPPDPGDLV